MVRAQCPVNSVGLMNTDIDPKVDIGVAIGIGPIPAGWEFLLLFHQRRAVSRCKALFAQLALHTSLFSLPCFAVFILTSISRQGSAFKMRGPFCSSRQRRVESKTQTGDIC